MLSETSRRFHSLTEARSLIGDVQVVLPRSWIKDGAGQHALAAKCLSGKSISSSVGHLQRGQADIRVTDRHPIFGAMPWTSQYGQCQVQGLEMSLPYPALTNNQTLNEATVDRMLKEWIKFRFGVFEENGFVNDNIYPLTYTEGEEELLNVGCTEDSSEVRKQSSDP